jgi:hypothetical protein
MDKKEMIQRKNELLRKIDAEINPLFKAQMQEQVQDLNKSIYAETESPTQQTQTWVQTESMKPESEIPNVWNPNDKPKSPSTSTPIKKKEEKKIERKTFSKKTEKAMKSSLTKTIKEIEAKLKALKKQEEEEKRIKVSGEEKFQSRLDAVLKKFKDKAMMRRVLFKTATKLK